MAIPKLLRIKPLDAYPIGSVYISLDSTSPETLFGGVWERLKDKFLMPAGDTYPADTSGGSANMALTKSNMPAHTHTRGTMNITGEMTYVGHTAGVTHGINFDGTSYSGAFEKSGLVGNTYAIQQWQGANRSTGFKLDASRSWTGETSSEGGGRVSRFYPLILQFMHGAELSKGG